MRFAFGASLALVARVASIVPDFALYRVDRIMQLSVQLTRTWLVFWAIHTVLGMIAAGLIAAIVLGLVARTHQWYLYTIVGDSRRLRDISAPQPVRAHSGFGVAAAARRVRCGVRIEALLRGPICRTFRSPSSNRAVARRRERRFSAWELRARLS